MEHIILPAPAELVALAPAVESFFDAREAALVWPRHIYTRPDFQSQIAAQQQLLHVTKTVLDTLPPGVTLRTGLENHLLSEETVCALLSQLADYLEAEPAHGRIVLYLPFALTSPLPDGSPALAEANVRFQRAFRRAWLEQMKSHEVRANFVDGDVLETEKRTGDLPRVVKAAHLIPGLLDSHHLSLEELVNSVMTGGDDFTQTCIRDVVNKMWVQRLYVKTGVKTLPPALATHPELGEANDVPSLATIHTKLMTIAESVTEDGATPNRTKWLRQVAVERVIKETAHCLCKFLTDGTPLPKPEVLEATVILSYLEAIRMLMLQTGQLTADHRHWLTLVLKTATDQTRSAVVKVYRHAFASGFIAEQVLTDAGIHFPALAGPFSKNLATFKPSVKDFHQMVTVITEDPFLASRVYPAVILFGSQLKGYGADTADADVAVFVRPGTLARDETEINRRLQQIFADDRIGGSAVLFWLEGVSRLRIVRNTLTHGGPGLPSFTHVLMGGAWVGEESSIRTLQHQLLPQYLLNPTSTEDGKPVRERWLEEMERDSILYRLLHRGFERSYPVQSPYADATGDVIDGQSAFYDPTFRQIATVLFLTRVFFPNLDRL